MINRRGTPEDLADQVMDSVREDVEINFSPAKGNFSAGVLSTGCTLLDQAISGGVHLEGGIPAGIMIEIFGPESTGKTALMSEIIASCQARGGEAEIKDPEARYNKAYAEIYGVSVDEDHYDRPDTVKEVLDDIFAWEPSEESKDKINVFACDSIAALSTDMEMDDEDKMGGRRAKEFSAGLRKAARIIGKDNRIVIFTNQIRETMASFGSKTTTPGGRAIRFYTSVRIKLSVQGKVQKKVTVEGKEHTGIIGILSKAEIVKNSVDKPFRTADIYIMFGYGIDDIRGNLQYKKDMTKGSSYICPDGKSFRGMEQAIQYIEANNMQESLKKEVIEIWQAIEERMKEERKPKVRR